MQKSTSFEDWCHERRVMNESGKANANIAKENALCAETMKNKEVSGKLGGSSKKSAVAAEKNQRRNRNKNAEKNVNKNVVREVLDAATMEPMSSQTAAEIEANANIIITNAKKGKKKEQKIAKQRQKKVTATENVPNTVPEENIGSPSELEKKKTVVMKAAEPNIQKKKKNLRRGNHERRQQNSGFEKNKTAINVKSDGQNNQKNYKNQCRQRLNKERRQQKNVRQQNRGKRLQQESHESQILTRGRQWQRGGRLQPLGGIDGNQNSSCSAKYVFNLNLS